MANLAFDMPRTLLRQLLVRPPAQSIRMSRDRLFGCPEPAHCCAHDVMSQPQCWAPDLLGELEERYQRPSGLATGLFGDIECTGHVEIVDQGPSDFLSRGG